MKVCRSNYLEIVKIVPFSERRSCFCEFAKQNEIKIEKINYKNHISKKELRKAYKIYKSKPSGRNFFHEKKLIVKAFEDVEKFLMGEKWKNNLFVFIALNASADIYSNMSEYALILKLSDTCSFIDTSNTIYKIKLLKKIPLKFKSGNAIFNTNIYDFIKMCEKAKQG